MKKKEKLKIYFILKKRITHRKFLGFRELVKSCEDVFIGNNAPCSSATTSEIEDVVMWDKTLVVQIKKKYD